MNRHASPSRATDFISHFVVSMTQWPRSSVGHHGDATATAISGISGVWQFWWCIACRGMSSSILNTWHQTNLQTMSEKGYQWSMTHSFFAQMGGFVYHDHDGNLHMIKSLKFLELCEANKIANPLIMVKEIQDKSKSDALAKAILAVQLLWFTVQVVARGSCSLAVTLLELDMVSMAALALLILWFWWDKPHHPKCPHIFYSPQDVRADPQTQSAL